VDRTCGYCLPRPCAQPRSGVRGGVTLAIAALAAVLVGESWWFCAHGQPAAPPPSVTVALVTVEDVAPVYSFIGHVVTIQSVQIVPRVTAFIDNVPVQYGTEVRAGQVLIQLQKAQYEASLQSAQAQLASAQAALRLAQISYDRAAQLVRQQAQPQSTLDQATATRDQNQASVLSAQANLAQAGLDLSYCTITSPISGQIGAVAMTKGNLVTPSTPALLTINELDPIRVIFSPSYREMIAVERETGASRDKIAAGLTMRLKLPDGSEYDHDGRISFLDNRVDQATGTVNVYVDFPNPDRLLLPGAYVTVEVREAAPQRRPLVPVEAVQIEESGRFVLVVGPDNKVRQQPVVLGPQIAQDFVVNNGLSGGERVIVAGVQKVRPGETVIPVAAPPPSASEPGAHRQSG
jgi:membrane fusion protein, multidrug efflux system